MEWIPMEWIPMEWMPMEWMPMEWMPMEWRRPEVGSRARLGSSCGESAGKPPPGPKGQPNRGRKVC